MTNESFEMAGTTIRIPRRTLLGAAAATGLAAGLGTTTSAAADPGTATGQPPPGPDDLAQTGADQFRWLSVKNSRIVINPYDFNQSTTEMQQSDAPDLPLSAGYFAHNEVTRIKDLLLLYGHGSGRPNPTPPETTFDDEFDTLDPAWATDDGVQASTTDSLLTVKLAADAPHLWGWIEQELTVDLDTYPTALISIVEGTGQWSLKVNDGTLPVDITLQGDNEQTGTLTYDIPSTTGWSGTKTFTIRLFVVGREAELTVDRLTVQSVPDSWLTGSADHTVTWRPYALEFSATFDIGAQVTGHDVFHDVSSVTRVLRVSGLPTGGPDRAGLTAAGRYVGTPQFDPGTGVLRIVTAHASYAIALGSGRSIRYYADRTELQVGGPELEAPGESGYWAVDLAGTDQAIGIGFAYRGEQADVDARARSAARRSAAESALVRRRREIAQVLKAAPQPRTFALPAVPDRGISAEDVRRMYYLSFVFFDVNVLPPAPEVGYDYPQVATGKPSLWNHGADGARPSASWDSLLAMQYFGYLDPDTAWRSFEGLISLVDEDGRLGGESLPSRKAQTAWVLYALTGDSDRLSSIYDDLRRHLLWAEANPRWIFGDHDIPAERDAEFVVSLLIDFGYARKIAEVIGRSSDGAFWDQHHAELLDRYGAWFFRPGGVTLQYHYVDGSIPDAAGNTLWVTTGLHLTGIDGAQRKALLDRFGGTFDTEQALCGWRFPDVKAPDVTFTAYGLIDVDRAATANEFVQGMLRGMVESRSLAEVYSTDDSGAALGVGVRPSTFGAFNIIDFVWILNGFLGGHGLPAFVNLPTTDGGIDQLRVLGRHYAMRASAHDGLITLSGPAISSGSSVLEAPIGQVVALPPDSIEH